MSVCEECGARVQENMDGDVVHARAGTIECPPIPFSEGPVQIMMRVLFGILED
jgi:hypothetical protein